MHSNRDQKKLTAFISTTKKQECLHKTLKGKSEAFFYKEIISFALQKPVWYLPPLN